MNRFSRLVLTVTALAGLAAALMMPPAFAESAPPCDQAQLLAGICDQPLVMAQADAKKKKKTGTTTTTTTTKTTTTTTTTKKGAGTCAPSGFAKLTRNCTADMGGCQRMPDSCPSGWCCP